MVRSWPSKTEQSDCPMEIAIPHPHPRAPSGFRQIGAAKKRLHGPATYRRGCGASSPHGKVDSIEHANTDKPGPAIKSTRSRRNAGAPLGLADPEQNRQADHPHWLHRICHELGIHLQRLKEPVGFRERPTEDPVRHMRLRRALHGLWPSSTVPGQVPAMFHS